MVARLLGLTTLGGIVQALCASAENAYGAPCFESRIEVNLWHAEEQIDSYLTKHESRPRA
jgi:hypothetical protein